MRKNCPVCRQNAFFEFNPPKLADISNFPLSGSIHLNICLNCSFAWNNSTSLENDYQNYYLNFNKHQIRSEFGRQVDSEYFTTVVERIDNLLNSKSNKKILDYGSGDRALADIALHAGFSEAACLDVGKDEDKHNEYFQAITCLHSLEHFFNPIKAISEMNQLLCMGGILYIAVPDAMRYEDTYYGAFNAVDLEHINHFTIPSLSALIERCGFEVKIIKQSDRRVSEEAFYPEIWVAASKIGAPEKSTFKAPTLESLENVKFLDTWRSYILKSNSEFERLQSWTCDKLEKYSNTQIILYGLGSPALRIAEFTKDKIGISFGDSDSRLNSKEINGSKIQNLSEILDCSRSTPPHYLVIAVNGARIKAYLRQNGVFDSQISMFEWDK